MTLAQSHHLPLYQELSNMKTVEYIAGGSALNSIRVCQWMLGNVMECCYIGSIGTKEADLKQSDSNNNNNSSRKLNSDYLKECVTSDKVFADFFEHPLYSTGTCAVCITDNKERSMVTNLAASKEGFKIFNQDIDNNEINLINKNQEYKKYRENYYNNLKIRMKNADIIYSEGFFVNTSVTTMIEAGKIQFNKYLNISKKELNNYFAINFSANFIVEAFTNEINSVLDYASHVFTNEKEIIHYGYFNNLLTSKNVKNNDSIPTEDDITQEEIYHVAKLISLREYKTKWNEKEDKRPLTVVCTHGKYPTVVAQNGNVRAFKVPHLDQTKIVDLNGAGDAFVGGFLSQLYNEKDIQTCVEAGNYAARQIIQSAGTKLAHLGKPRSF